MQIRFPSRWLLQLLWQDAKAHPLRNSLTLSGIAIGLGLLLAIYSASQSAITQFGQTVESLSGQNALEISSPITGQLPESLLVKLLPLEEQGITLHPELESTLPLLEPKSKRVSGKVISVLGLDMLHPPGVLNSENANNQSIWASYASTKGQPKTPWAIFQPQAAYAGEGLARAHHWQVGDSMDVLVGDVPKSLVIAGILSSKGSLGSASSQMLLLDIGNMQQLLGFGQSGNQLGHLSRIGLEFTNSSLAPQSQISLIKSFLPPGLEVNPPQSRKNQLQQLFSAYSYNLNALSLVALLVGTGLIYNTLSTNVVRRRPLIGTLRAIGSSSLQIAQLFLLEGFILGSFGSAFGIFTGWALGWLTTGAVKTTMASLYGIQASVNSPLSIKTALLGFALGLLVTLLASLLPALEASRIPPAEALQSLSEQRHWKGPPKWLNWLAFYFWLLTLGVSAITYFKPPFIQASGQMALGYTTCTLALAGALCWSASWLWFLLKLFLKILVSLGFWPYAQIGLQLLRGSLGRTAVTVASVGVATTMLVSLTVMIGSFRQTVNAWVAQSLRADLFIQPAGADWTREAGLLSQPAIKVLMQLPKIFPFIQTVEPFLDLPIRYQGHPVRLGIGSFDTFLHHGQVQFTDGEPFEQVAQRVNRLKTSAVLISEPMAYHNHLHKGDMLILPATNGSAETLKAKIEGVYIDYASDKGYIIMDRSLYRKFFTPLNSHKPNWLEANSVSIYLKPKWANQPAASKQVETFIEEHLPASSQLLIRSNGQLRQEVLRVFDQTFAITYALQAIAALVALLAVTNTLLTLTLEHQRSFAILKTLGAEAFRLRQAIFAQATLLVTAGYGVGLGTGLFLAWLLVEIINPASFGWHLQWVFPWASLFQAYIILLLAGWLAALIPAKLASGPLKSRLLSPE